MVSAGSVLERLSSFLAEIGFRAYKDESELCLVQGLIEQELSEPYSVFTYRYFVNQWPKLCLLVCAHLMT